MEKQTTINENRINQIHGQKILWSLHEKAEPGHTALLLVDLINDTVKAGGKAHRAGRDIDRAPETIAIIGELLNRARQRNILIVYVTHVTLRDLRSSSPVWFEARSHAIYSADEIALEGTWGQEIIEELPPLPEEIVIKKHRFSGFVGTDLDMILRSHGIKSTVIVGGSTNSCIAATAWDAFHHEYYVVLPKDALLYWQVELHEAELQTAHYRYATVTDSTELLAIWKEM